MVQGNFPADPTTIARELTFLRVEDEQHPFVIVVRGNVGKTGFPVTG